MKKTHRGDDGYTDIRGLRVAKDSPIIEFIGGLDELTSFLGIVRSVLSRDVSLNTVTAGIKSIQITLMSIASIVAGKAPGDNDLLLQGYVDDIEKEIIIMNRKISLEQCLVIPGGTYESSLLHFARALCRYVERRAVPLLRDGVLNKYAYIYLNRLSDLLYLYALYVDIIKGVEVECVT